MSDELLVFNGVSGVTGDYLLSPMSPADVTVLAQGRVADPEHVKELRSWHERVTQAFLGPREGVDPKDLAQSGWGVIFAHGADPAVKEALAELLDHRRQQAARVQEHYYREFTGERAYRPGESKQHFLARHGAGAGPADPENVPYYLLIVGDPETIPFAFQYQLDVQYAVGRIHFDTLDTYAAYAASVVSSETSGSVLDPRAVFFGARNPGDQATAMSSSELVVPLAEKFGSAHPDWAVESFVGEPATKKQLGQVLGGDPPALLFTATHGVGFPNGHPLQSRRQGALVCQEWQGAGSETALAEETYFSGDDLGADAGPHGLIAFHFACFGAGTPKWDDFAHRALAQRAQLAPVAQVATLPKRLLGHPGGGALAAVGHVDRAWGYSFTWPGAGRQTQVFESCLSRLATGHPIGSAFEYFNERYAELSSDLSSELEDIEFGKVPDPLALSAMWTANNDARGFAIVGDPAVRLRVDWAAASASAQGPSGPSERAAQGPSGPSERAAQGPSGPERVARGRQPDKEGPPIAEAAPHHASPTGAEPSDIEFGLFSGLREARERVSGALNSLVDSLSGVIERATQDMSTLEVRTYVSDDLAAVTYEGGKEGFGGGAELRAMTRISLDGDVSLVLPRQREEIDDTVLKMHLDMTEQGRVTRQELLKSATSALAALVSGLKLL